MPETAAVGRALEFLQREQLESGQFPMEYSLLGKRHFGTDAAETHPEKSPFCSAYVAHSLSFSGDHRARKMIHRAVEFLKGEMTGDGLWRYWCKDAPLHRQIPPDVDDTACISDLLRSMRQPVPENEDLLLSNMTTSGMFYTWIIPRVTTRASARWWRTVLGDITWGRAVSFWRAGAARGDVDSVVNANVLLYLGERDVTGPVIERLLDIAESGHEDRTDRWYRSVPAFYYAVSRAYARGIERLAPAGEHLDSRYASLGHPDGRIGEDSLQTAMAVCSLMNFGHPPAAYARQLEYLGEAQESDGGWAACPIYFDGRRVPQIAWSSRCVTTAFCIEALVRSEAAGSPVTELQ